jgi:predicted metal-dependent phosphoesterase TrpH
MNETSRADMHVHSTASQLSKLGIQNSLHLPECATPPDEVYTLAKRRGMDFVTITDHDTIDGALTLNHLPDTFISEELTAWFKGEPQAVHVLCYGIRPAITSGCRRTVMTSRRVPATCTRMRSPRRSHTRSTLSRRL